MTNTRLVDDDAPIASDETPRSAPLPAPPPFVGIGLVVLASVLWSTSALFARAPQLNLWSQDERGAVLAFWRAIFALTLMIPMVRRPTFAWGMLPMVLCFAAMNWTYLTALIQGPPANAIWLQNIAPVWVMLVGWALLKERPGRADWWMLGFCVSGLGLILVFQILNGPASAWWPALMAILSGMLYAGVVISLRHLRNHDSAWLIALNHLVTAMVMAPMVLGQTNLPTGHAWWILAAFGVFQMGLPYLLFARGLKSIPGHLASVLTLIEPILLPVWLFLVWRNQPDYESPRWWTIFGASLILVGLLFRFGYAVRQRVRLQGTDESDPR